MYLYLCGNWPVPACRGTCSALPAQTMVDQVPDKVVLTLCSAPAQIDATKLLALLLEAPDARQAAAEHVGSLTEQFFAIASTYLTMVRPSLPQL